MGMPNELDQKSQKNNNQSETGYFSKYKQRVINKEQTKIDMYKESSGSWIFWNRFGVILLDILMWCIIGFFAYTWWITRAQPVGCERITVDLCNYCYGTMKTTLESIGNMPIGIGNMTLLGR